MLLELPLVIFSVFLKGKKHPVKRLERFVLMKETQRGSLKMFRRKGFFPGKMSCPCMFLRLKNLSFQKRDSVVGFSI